jgi:hypothetical protein
MNTSNGKTNTDTTKEKRIIRFMGRFYRSGPCATWVSMVRLLFGGSDELRVVGSGVPRKSILEPWTVPTFTASSIPYLKPRSNMRSGALEHLQVTPPQMSPEMERMRQIRQEQMEKMRQSMRPGTVGGGGGGGSFNPTTGYGHPGHTHWEDQTVVM